MLTGKDIVKVLGFTNIGPASMETYNYIAEQLNNVHIAPLRDDIEAQRTTIVALMESVAVLQKQIVPLQGLIQDQQALLAEMHLSWWDVHPSKAQQLEQRKDALSKRAQQLIGEEHKDATNA